MQIASTHHLVGKMIAEMPIETKVGHPHLLFDVQKRLLGLRLDAQEFGREARLGFVLVLAARRTSPRPSRLAVFLARFTFVLALLGLLFLFFGADDLLIAER